MNSASQLSFLQSRLAYSCHCFSLPLDGTIENWVSTPAHPTAARNLCVWCGGCGVCVYSHSSHVRLFFDSMNCSSPGSSVHRISQVRILEWVAISYSKDLHDPRMEPASLASSAAAGRFFTAAQRGKLDTCKDVCGSLRKGNPISQVLSSAMQLQLFVPSLV